MATYTRSDLFASKYKALSDEQKSDFKDAVRMMVLALPPNASRPDFPPQLRVKTVKGRPDLWEMSWAGDGRAVFRYGSDHVAGHAHIIWLTIGTHKAFTPANLRQAQRSDPGYSY